MAVALPANALTTLAALKPELGIDATDESQDARLARLIGVASDFIERWCGREFGKAERTERYRGFGMPRMWLNVAPLDVTKNITVKLDGQEYVLGESFKIDDAKRATLWRSAGWGTTAAYVAGANYEPLDGQERFAYEITYTGGYVLPKDEVLPEDATDEKPALARTLPYDLEQVCIELITAKRAMTARDRTVKSESLLNWSASYTDSDVTDSMLSVLQAYKVMA